MNSTSLLKANTRQTLSRFRALLIALAVGMALLVASAAVAGGTIAADAHKLDSESGLSTLELLSVAPSGTPKQLTAEAIAAIKAYPGVEAVIGGGSAGTSLAYVRGGGPGAGAAADQAFSGVFWAMPRFAWSQPPVVSATTEPSLAKGEILLPDSYLGVSLKDLVGADITVEYTVATGKDSGSSATIPMTVAGVYDNTSPKRSGDSGVYLADADFESLLAALQGAPGGKLPRDFVYPSCWVKASSVAQANQVAQQLTDAGFYVNRGGGEAALPRALALLQQANTILAVLLGLFGIGIGVTVAGTWSNLRRWDVGVLASLGWSPGRVLGVYAAELAIVGVIVGALAAGLGTVISAAASLSLQGTSVLGVQLPPGVSWPSPIWLVGIFLGAPLALTLGAAPRILALGRIEPDDALRRPD